MSEKAPAKKFGAGDRPAGLVDGLGLGGIDLDAVDRLRLGVAGLDGDLRAVGDGDSLARGRDAGRAGRARRDSVCRAAARRVYVLPPPDSETNCSWGRATRRSIPFSSLRSTDAFVSESVLGVTPPPQRLVFLEASRLRLAEVEEAVEPRQPGEQARALRAPDGPLERR